MAHRQHRAETPGVRDRLKALGLPEDASAAEVRAELDKMVAELEQPLSPEPSDRADVAGSENLDADTYADVAALEATAEPVSAAPVRRRRSRRGLPRKLVAAAVALLVPALIWGVYALGAPKPAAADAAANPHGTSMPTAAPAVLDQAQVESLQQKVAANPADVASLRSLATLHFKAEKFPEAAQWLRRVLEHEPGDNDARLVLGVSLFNAGDVDGAEREWTDVARRDPASADPHYNLGFLYMSKTPPQLDRCEAEWRKVTELAPGSDMAKTVTSHLERLNGAAPTPAATRK